MRRRRVLATLASAATTAGCVTTSTESEPAFLATSPPLEDGGQLPERFSCDGAGVSPPFVVESVPDEVTALAVVAQFDLGVINNPVFWTLWNVPSDRGEIPAGLPRGETVERLDGARQGRQQGVDPGYDPVCPPPGDSATHWFEVYGLENDLAVEGGAVHDDAVDAIESEAVASSRITLSYARPADSGTATSE